MALKEEAPSVRRTFPLESVKTTLPSAPTVAFTAGLATLACGSMVTLTLGFVRNFPSADFWIRTISGE